MAHNVMSAEADHQVMKVKRLLGGWRMALLPLKSIILWEQQWHPFAILGSVSAVFLIIWMLNLNSLATFAIIGLIFNLVDFIVPVVCNSLYGPEAWTGQHEKTYEEMCKNLVIFINSHIKSVKTYYSLRETSPCVYFILSIIMSCTLAWVASNINNILLFYIVTSVMLLLPGLHHKGTFNALFSLLNMAPKIPFLKTD